MAAGGCAMDIALENEGGTGYAAGDTVSGQVVLELLQDLHVLGLHIRAHGGAAVAFTPRKGRHPHSPSSADRAEYFNEEVTLLAANSGETCMFTAGRHTFPFHFQLPVGLVTSFTGKYGRIQYQLTAVLERPSVPALSVQRELRFTSRIDVNSPSLLTPVERSKEHMVGCCFLTSGPICLSAKIGRKGFCNGEAIPIYAEIENGSSRLIVPKAAIYQTQTFVVQGKTKAHKQMLARVRGNHIASGSTETWNGKTLKIPPVTPTITDCHLINVEYSLAVYIHIPGAKKLVVELPLVIGTVPFNAFMYQTSSVARQFTLDMSWLTLALPEQPEAPPNYADIVSEEDLSQDTPSVTEQDNYWENLQCPPLFIIQEFRFQPPPMYSEIDPYPNHLTEEGNTLHT